MMSLFIVVCLLLFVFNCRCLFLQVGLMRDGRLLAESPPNDLITSYRMNVSTCDFTCAFHVIKSFVLLNSCD